MKSNERSSEQFAPFLTTACIIPVVSSSIGANWLPTMMVSLGTLLIYVCYPILPEEMHSGVRTLRVVVLTVLLAHYLKQTSICWPGRGAQYVVPAVLGLLALYAMNRGEWTAVRSVNVLRYGVFAVLGAVLYAGIRNIKLQSMIPTGELPRRELILSLLLPLLAGKEKKGRSKLIPLAAIVTSLATAGAYVNDLYQFSRTISIQGITEHMESIAAGAITVGYYALLCYLLVCIKGNINQNHQATKLTICLVAAYTGMLLDLELEGIAVVLAIVVIWCIIPSIGILKRKMSKQEKSA